MINVSKVALAASIFVLVSCSKESLKDQKGDKTVTPSFLSVDPVIEEYSDFGEIVLADEEYDPYFDECNNATAVYLFYPNNGPWEGKTVEIYRFNDIGEIGEGCGSEFILTKVEGNNGNPYVYCEAPASNCYEGEVNGHCALVFCDN